MPESVWSHRSSRLSRTLILASHAAFRRLSIAVFGRSSPSTEVYIHRYSPATSGDASTSRTNLMCLAYLKPDFSS